VAEEQRCSFCVDIASSLAALPLEVHPNLSLLKILIRSDPRISVAKPAPAFINDPHLRFWKKSI